jgi:hypothetical protein
MVTANQDNFNQFLFWEYFQIWYYALI